MAQFPPIMKDMPVFLHGGDYNPEQWLSVKDVTWPVDMKMAKLAKINTLSVGIFSWQMLEPEEGRYDFSWLDEVMDMLAANGIKACLATPGGAKPAWMAAKYPETLRVNERGQRNIYGTRHNHCLTSRVFREKARAINTLLAERYKDHPALGMWHFDNELGGSCFCENCTRAFREWLKKRYGTIENLNAKWWNAFWSHCFTSFDEINPPMPHGDQGLAPLTLAWRRYTSEQYADYFEDAAEPLRRITPDTPVTANLMHTYPGIDYFDFAKHIDVVSWDNYPEWTNDARDYDIACDAAFRHDLMRMTGRGRPFMLMESAPSAVNWQDVNRLRMPGLHTMQSLQAVAHGSDSVQYFQFRKGRGANEKYHGAVVSHDERTDNRVFKEVCGVGERLSGLSEVLGSTPENEVAVIYDWNVRWVLDNSYFGLRDKKYEETAVDHYSGFLKNGAGVDVIDETMPLDGYKIVATPMTILYRDGFAERVRAFVENGGTFVSTYCSGWNDEEDLAYMGGFPGPLKDVAGYWDEETDAYDETQSNRFKWNGKTYRVKDFAAVLHLEGAKALAAYEEKFYKGAPAITENRFGKGRFICIAARTEQDFLIDFYRNLMDEAGIAPAADVAKERLLAARRIGDNGSFVFVMNPSPDEKPFRVPDGAAVISGVTKDGAIDPYGVIIYKE